MWMGVRVVAVMLVAGLVLAPGAAVAQPCARADFEGVVDQASAKLRDLTQANTDAFQAKLRQKRGWSQEQLMAEGARFVRDETIARYDEQSADLLARINQGGDGGGKSADCKMLEELRGTMARLVELQQAKWRHMIGGVEAELAK